MSSLRSTVRGYLGGLEGLKTGDFVVDLLEGVLEVLKTENK